MRYPGKASVGNDARAVPEWSKWKGHADTWVKTLPSRGNSESQDCEVVEGAVCWGNNNSIVLGLSQWARGSKMCNRAGGRANGKISGSYCKRDKKQMGGFLIRDEIMFHSKATNLSASLLSSEETVSPFTCPQPASLTPRTQIAIACFPDHSLTEMWLLMACYCHPSFNLMET